jgi:hypothetical protein
MTQHYHSNWRCANFVFVVLTPKHGILTVFLSITSTTYIVASGYDMIVMK